MTMPSMPLSSEGVRPTAVTRPLGWLVALHSFANGVMGAAVVVSALLAVEFDFGVPRLLGAAVLGFLGFAIVSAGEGLATLLWKLLRLLFRTLHFARGVQLLQTVPAVPLGQIFGAFIFIAGDILWPDSFLQHIVLPIAGEITIVLTGLTVMMLTLVRMAGRSVLKPYLLAGVIGLDLAFIGWVARPGFDHYLVTPPKAAVPLTLTLKDPAQAGPYAVQTLSYGSGQNTRRPQYGPAADLITPVVDGSAIFAGYEGITATYFEWYWGFDFSQLPLNGLVWYPVGEGPFPLVLIVHGNHAMSDYSEPGYAYLAEHLASHGYIAVSVDENFLNGLVFFDGEFAEMPLRAWLLLQHLRQWQSWKEGSKNPFVGKVDLNRIILIGHSRGGEAVAWAAHLNWQTMTPVTAVSSPSDFGFGIRGVVAIAPSDAYAGPVGRKPTLDHSNYLLLAGGHDADTFLLYGQQQYNRVHFHHNPHGFKALAYIYRANHGQFNSVWGNQDRGLYNSWLLNRRPLLTQTEQQQAAKLLITSFVRATLNDEHAYRGIFNQPGVTQNWLPEMLIVTQYQEEGLIPVDTNSGSTALAATEVREATAVAQEITFAKVEQLKLRDGQHNQGNRALHLGWDAGSQPTYVIALPEGQAADWGLTPAHALTFALASVPGKPIAAGVMVELETAAGETARVPLDGFGSLVPSLPAYLVKANWLIGLNGFPDKTISEEVVLQTYTLPLTAFQTANPAFQIDRLQTIRFLFEGHTAGAIYLDEIGFGYSHQRGFE